MELRDALRLRSGRRSDQHKCGLGLRCGAARHLTIVSRVSDSLLSVGILAIPTLVFSSVVGTVKVPTYKTQVPVATKVSSQLLGDRVASG